jgi:hypothetical protein
MAGQNVAEAYLTNPGAASDIAVNSFTFGLKPTVADEPLSIAIFANPSMQVTTTGDGSAKANIYFSIAIGDAKTGAVLLVWAPNGNPLGDTTLNAGSTSGIEDPYSLNAQIDCTGNCSKTYAPSGINEWTLSYEGAPGQQYDVTVRWYETVNVSIPEPASMALTGGALLLVSLALRRKRNR